MTNFLLHQVVHGYRRGHQRLVASVELESRDEDATVYLSDLSGLPVKEEIPPYLTVYPLPSGAFFAFARTWIDSDAPREGCVLTHTILIPTAYWLQGLSARTVARILRKPNRGSLESFSEPLHVNADTLQSPGSTARLDVAPNDVRNFSRLFFVEGKKPIVWFGATHPDDILIRLLDTFWPSLRQAIAACTYGLKTRELQDQLFDIIFAPSLAASRFGNVDERNFVGGRFSTSQRPIHDRRLDLLTELVFSEITSPHGSMSVQFRDLMADLPSDPTSLFKLVVLKDLQQRGLNHAASAVAALDVLAAIAPSAKAALPQKQEAIERALSQSLNEDPHVAIEMLHAVDQRLTRPAYRHFRFVRSNIISLIARLVNNEPKAGIEVLKGVKLRRAVLLRGVASGLRTTKERLRPLLTELELTRPSYLDAILGYEPELPRVYIDDVVASSQGGKETQDVVRWLQRATPRRRRAMSKQLVTTPAAVLDWCLLETVLVSVDESGAQELLETGLRSATDAMPDRVWAPIEHLSMKFPHILREHVRSNGLSASRMAATWGALLPLSLKTLSTIRTVATSKAHYRVCALAAFLQRDGVFDSLDCESGAELVIELLSGIQDSNCADSISDALRRTLIELNVGSIANLVCADAPVWHDLNYLDARVIDLLAHAIFESACTSYFRGSLSSEGLKRWIELPFIKAHARQMDPMHIRETWKVRGDSPGPELCARIWSVLEMFAPFLMNKQDAFSHLINAAFIESKLTWSDGLTEKWVGVVRTVKSDSYFAQATPVEVQALHAALENPQLPLSKLVQITFPAIYRQTTSVGISFFDAFWNTGWDKGKELRRALIQSFVQSKWPPRVLAVVADDAGIFDKVMSRLARTGNQAYMLAVLSDLEQHPSAVNHQLANRLRASRLKEDWD